MSPPASPSEIRRLAEERVLRVTWRDGHASDYPFAYLRGWCPCAGCQGHGGQRHYVEAANSDLGTVSLVGTYAIGLVWGDGHDTGIYSFSYLRQMCPCEACGGARTEPTSAGRGSPLPP